jgi:hypothetical protein
VCTVAGLYYVREGKEVAVEVISFDIFLHFIIFFRGGGFFFFIFFFFICFSLTISLEP